MKKNTMKNWKKCFESSSWYESYKQEEDTSSPRTDVKVQELSLEAIDAASNEHYLVISTQRWALDVEEIDSFCQLLKDFMNRELKQKKTK